MSQPSAFLTHGLDQARQALACIMRLTGADRRPVVLRRGVARKAMARLRQLEVIVRRLLVLMALALVLPPVRPRAAPAGPAGPVEGIETKAVAGPRGFALSPKVLPAAGPDASGLFPCSVRASSGPVPAAPLLARLAALRGVLDAPAAHARRLARSLHRQQARGEARPVALPMARTPRMPLELGAIATALPELLRAALETWESSG